MLSWTHHADGERDALAGCGTLEERLAGPVELNPLRMGVERVRGCVWCAGVFDNPRVEPGVSLIVGAFQKQAGGGAVSS